MTTAEVQVISALLENKDMMTLTGGEVDDFFRTYGDVWKYIRDYYGRYRSIPEPDDLKKKFDFERSDVTGPTEYYLDTLREQYLRGQLDAILLKAASELDERAPGVILEGISKRIARLNRLSGSLRDVDLTDVDDAIQHLEHTQRLVEERGGSFGIPTGIKTIDDNYHTGMAPGHFINLIGWPAKGKSLISTKIACNVWKMGYKPMIVSLEMSPEMVRERAYSILASDQGFRLSDFTRGAVNVDDFRTWGKSTLADKNGFIIVSNDGRTVMTPQAVQAKIDQHKPDLVIVDYHQLFMDNNRSQNATERAKNASTEFKLLATANNIPLIDIVSATSNDVSDREDPPMMAQVAWSRQLEYDADLAVAVHKREDGIIEMVARKNRHGDEFAFFIESDIDKGIFNERFDL